MEIHSARKAWRSAVLTVGYCIAFSAVGIVRADAPPGGVVVDFSPAESEIYMGNPSLAILPDGTYVASHDAFGPGHPFSRTYFFRSLDQGASWQGIGSVSGQYESTLFVHDDDLYLIGGGTAGGNEFVSIRKSTNGGNSWTQPLNDTTGRLVTGGFFNAGATQVVTHNGRIWRAMEQVEPSIPSGSSTNYRSFVVSAPVDSDLLNAASWTVSNSLLADDFAPGTGWIEGGIVVTPEGDINTMLRTAWLGQTAAFIDISADGTTASFNPATGYTDFLGGGTTKFTVRYDEVSGRYWSLTNNQDVPGSIRNVMSLVSSSNLTDWELESNILQHPDAQNVGFQYADWQFDGSDMVFVSRTAYDGAANFHDANYTTFHRIENFRSFALDSVTTLDAVADTQIDEHPSWADSPGLGSSVGLRVQVRDPNVYADDYESQALIKWDVSSIPVSDIVSQVELQLQGFDGYVGYGIEVYAIDAGPWDEATTTWNSWHGQSTELTLLGTMQPFPRYGAEGQTSGLTVLSSFAAPGLTDLVQEWVAGDHPNLGLLLKWAGSPAFDGDEFASREDTTDPAPRLVVYHSAAPLLFGDYNGNGTVDASDYTAWRDALTAGTTVLLNDPTPGIVDESDFLYWRDHFGENLGAGVGSIAAPVPEPCAAMLGVIGAIGLTMIRRNAAYSQEHSGKGTLCLKDLTAVPEAA